MKLIIKRNVPEGNNMGKKDKLVKVGLPSGTQ